MKALILNSGVGARMGALVKDKPKCMMDIGAGYTILSWQLRVLEDLGIREVVITTGPFKDELRKYVESLQTELQIEFIHNELYRSTNYIYSMYCAQNQLVDDILYMHGDLVVEHSVIRDMMDNDRSTVAVDSLLELPKKDFRAKLDGNVITAIDVTSTGADCIASQPLYKIIENDMLQWNKQIAYYCENNMRSVYAENALNDITNIVKLYPMELEKRLCCEIDNSADLQTVSTTFAVVINENR